MVRIWAGHSARCLLARCASRSARKVRPPGTNDIKQARRWRTCFGGRLSRRPLPPRPSTGLLPKHPPGCLRPLRQGTYTLSPAAVSIYVSKTTEVCNPVRRTERMRVDALPRGYRLSMRMPSDTWVCASLLVYVDDVGKSAQQCRPSWRDIECAVEFECHLA